MHLGGNMLFLWVFGPPVEEGMGRWIFLPAYLMFGLVATLVHSLNTFATHVDVPCVGASGAISGLMGAYFAMCPKGMLRYFIFIWVRGYLVALPAWLALGMWFVEQGFMAFYISDYTNVAVFAHLGGFACGALFGFIFSGRKSQTAGFASDRASKGPDQPADPQIRLNELKKAVEREPLDLKLRHALAVAAARAGNAQEAIEASKYIYHRLPDHDLGRRFDLRLLQTSLGESDGTAKGIFELAEGFYVSNNYRQAHDHYLKVLTGWPDYPKRSMALVRVGDILVNHLNNPAAAVPYLEEAVKGDPRSGLVQEAQTLLKKTVLA